MRPRSRRARAPRAGGISGSSQPGPSTIRGNHDADAPGGIAVGALLAATGTADVVDAHAIVLARAVQSIMVVTSDPDDLAALDPAVRLHVV
ncbi:hypothetical protein ACIBG0_24040 [Nocardia sp. NPDC050630]|uniref:hypothetical protein n=1 Tax=Nocardia sp. NPDC050630 TaxID=3364321 RepID=UPI00379A4B88